MYATQIFVLICLTRLVSGESSDESTAYDFSWRRDKYPNPVTDPIACRRHKSSNLCDADRLLKGSQAKFLEQMITKIGNETGCICKGGCPPGKNGIIVGIALMQRMYIPYNVNTRRYVNEYADYLREEWQLGHCKNDLLIVVSTDDRFAVSSLGKNTAKVLPSSIVDDIHEETKGHFQSDDQQYYQGLEAMVNSYYDSIQKLDLNEDSIKFAFPSILIIVVIAFSVLIVFICFIAFICYVKRKVSKDDEADDVESNSIGNMLKKNFRHTKDQYTLRNDVNDIAYDMKSATYISCDKDDQVDKDQESSGHASGDDHEDEECYEEESDDSDSSSASEHSVNNEQRDVKVDVNCESHASVTEH